MSNITKFPGANERRKRVNLREGRVECQISGRWLQFPKRASLVGGESFMFVDVMTRNGDDRVKKLCELVLTKEDLASMLSRIPTKE